MNDIHKTGAKIEKMINRSLPLFPNHYFLVVTGLVIL